MSVQTKKKMGKNQSDNELKELIRKTSLTTSEIPDYEEPKQILPYEFSNQFDNLLSQAQIGMLFIDENLKIRQITPLMIQSTNLSLSDIGRSVQEVDFLDGYDDFSLDIIQAFAEGEIQEHEIVDKNYTSWFVKIRPYKLNHKDVTGVLVIVFDIAKRLENTKSELKALMDSVPGGVVRFCYDCGLMIEYANDGFFSLSKTSLRKTLLKYQNRYDKLIYWDDWEPFRQKIEQCINSGETLSFEYRVIIDDKGTMEWRSIRAVILKNRNKPILQGIITNIDEQKNMRLHLKSLIDNVEGGIVRFFYNGDKIKFLYLSKRFYEMFGVTEEEYLQGKFNEIGLSRFFDVQKEVVKKNLDKALYENQYGIEEYLLRKNDGSDLWLQVCGAVVSRNANGIVCQCIANDVTKLKTTILALEKERERLDIIANISADALFQYDIKTKTLIDSSTLNGLLGKETVIKDYRNTIIAWNIVHPEDEVIFNKLCDALDEGEKQFSFELRVHNDSGEFRWIAVHGRTMFNRDGNPESVIGKVQDIHEAKCHEAELAEKSKLDSLTQLYNKETCNKIIKNWSKCDFGNNCSMLLVIDIDYFKEINDTLGHLFGDAILCSFTDELKNIFTKNSLIGRIGGDEFIVFMKNTDKAEAVLKARMLCNAARKIYLGDCKRQYLSCSIGMSEYNRLVIDYEEAFDRADKALYYVKRSGRNGVECFEKHTKYAGDIGYKNSFNRYYFIENKTNKISNNLHDFVVFSLELFEKSNNLKSALAIVLDRIGRYFDLDSILIMKTKRNYSADIIYQWNAQGILPSNVENIQCLEKQWDAVRRRINPDGIAIFEDLYTSEVKDIAVKLGIRSCLSDAVFEMNELKGIICFCNSQANRSWRNEEYMVLQDLSAILLSQAIKLQEQIKLNERTEKLVNYDALTDLPNFSYFKSLAEKEISSHSQEKYAVFYTDFSNFKYINETYSYIAGDRILYQYGQCLKNFKDAVAYSRITADSFVVVVKFDDLTIEKDKYVSLNKGFCQHVNNQFKLSNLILVSGLCAITKNIRSALEVAIDNANLARRSIKENSQTNCAIFTAKMQKKISLETELTVNMVSALKNDEFTVFYQPKISLLTGKICGAEALVRWIRKDGSIISPDSFIPLFEKNGFVTEVDFYVFEEVLKFLRGRLDRKEFVVPISVNFSRRHLEDYKSLDKIIYLIEKYQIDYRLLEFELTESMFINNTDTIKKYLKKLRKLGLSVSVDDFGSGYSSLNVLASVPANVIKLDRVFLYENKKENRELIKHLVEMLKRLDFIIVAEGVETVEQMEFLKNAGCDIAQGYYFSKPIPMMDFIKCL